MSRPPPATPLLDEHPIIVYGERLIEKNSARDWDAKTQRQARQIFRLFARLLKEQGVLEVAAIRQAHFGMLDDLLGSVAKSYGKSVHDEQRSTRELREIGASKPANQRGLAPETVNRHLTFLGQLLAYLKGRGLPLDRDIDLSLLRGKSHRRGRSKRATFDESELRQLFSLPCFVGCAGWESHECFAPGPYVFHRALYFAILLLCYCGARREEICGLSVDDIRTVEIKSATQTAPTWPCLIIRPNKHRRLKNVQSERIMPVHPEVLRVGFLEYVEAIKKLGYDLVFPDLFSPTTRSPLGDRLYDEFSTGLKKTITSASERRKVLHSFRKNFGNALKQRGVSVEARADMLGHGGESVTDEVYCDPIALGAMLDFMMKLPIVSEHLVNKPINLLPWVAEKAVAPFSRPDRSRRAAMSKAART